MDRHLAMPTPLLLLEVKMNITLKKRKLTTIGGSQGFIVDKAFINNGQLEKDKEYDLTIVPSKGD